MATRMTIDHRLLRLAAAGFTLFAICAACTYSEGERAESGTCPEGEVCKEGVCEERHCLDSDNLAPVCADVAEPVEEGCLCQLVWDAADSEVQTQLEDILRCEGCGQQVVVSSLLSKLLAEGWDLRFRRGPSDRPGTCPRRRPRRCRSRHRKPSRHSCSPAPGQSASRHPAYG